MSPAVSAILSRSAFHPELPQRDVQVLLWGIIARAKVSQLDDGPRRVARTLLTESQIASIDGSALDVIPDQWIRKITGPLEGPVRRVLEAENRLRQLFANPGGAAYEEIERIAVIKGVPPPSERGRDVPARRWSWHPNGYFVRFLPNSYSNMRLQIYVPERFEARRDANAHLTDLRDMSGARLTLEYGAGGAAIAKATFTAPGGAPRPIEIQSAGAPAVASAREAVESVARFAGDGRRESPRARDVADVAQLIVSVSDDEASAFLERAWASAAGDWASADAAGAAAALERARYRSASLGGLLARPVASAPQSSIGGGWGGGGGGSGGGGGGGAGMPGGARQRLGPSLRKFGDDNSIDRARDAIDKFGKAKNALDLGTDPSGLLGFGIPDALFGKILDFNFDTWGRASSALAGDPPRQDFREYTKPDVAEVAPVQAGAEMTQAQADRLNALAQDLLAVNAHLRAAIVALDRHGGAVEAKERLWASRQAHALTYLKREAGLLSLKVAGHLEALAEGARGLPSRSAEAIAASRQRIARGWSDEDRKAAELAGLTPGDLEKLRMARLAIDDRALAIRPAEALRQAAEGMRGLGEHFASLPALAAPGF